MNGAAVAAFGQAVATAGGHPVDAVSHLHQFECLFRYAASFEPSKRFCVHLARARFRRLGIFFFGFCVLFAVVSIPRLLTHPSLLLLVGDNSSITMKTAMKTAEVAGF